MIEEAHGLLLLPTTKQLKKRSRETQLRGRSTYLPTPTLTKHYKEEEVDKQEIDETNKMEEETQAPPPPTLTRLREDWW